MSYWLFKSEPTTFSIDALAKKPKQTEHWDGVRNYQARNFMRDQMKPGDKGFFYHSSCDVPGIAGIVEVVSKPYPDATAFNPESKYFDPKSTHENPRWFVVDVKLIKKFPQIISLEQLRKHPKLHTMQILKKGNRLSITPVDAAEWKIINSLI
ncbi:MAG: EVE domain-containing protein [Gammaproteobacteria bacterium]|nr:EVE domain-containing protein [Gammaproteobacteria bacterium]